MSSPSLLSAHFLPSPLPFFALFERPCRLCVHHWAAHCTLAFVPAKQRCEPQWTRSALCALPEVHPQVSDCAWKTLRTQVGSIFVHDYLGLKCLDHHLKEWKCDSGDGSSSLLFLEELFYISDGFKKKFAAKFLTRRTNIKRALTSVAQDAINGVFSPWVVFVHFSLHHLVVILFIITNSAELGSQDATDCTHFGH